MRYSRPSKSTAHQPTEKGLAYPKSKLRYTRHVSGMSNGSITCVHFPSA